MVYCSLAHATHASQSKANGSLGIDGKRQNGFIDIGSQHRNAYAAGFLHKKGHLLDVVHVVGEYRGHVLGRVVGFEVGRLVGYPRVARGVGFVKGIGGKGFPVFPNFV